jgi:hypothetical protein
MVQRNCLSIFVKVPCPGFVKTRLAAELGEAQAAQVYRHLAHTTCLRLREHRPTELAYTPDDAEPEITAWLQPGWTARPQGAGDLGERLCRTFALAFARGAAKVAVIGSDCPLIELADLQTAWRQLGSHEVVLGPAQDGGYWLIALRRRQDSLFERIPWSTAAVLGETLARCQALGLQVHQLRRLRDVDTLADLHACSAQVPDLLAS